MKSRWLRALLLAGSEIFLTLLQMLVFFGAFMGLLMFSFPRGTGLHKLYGDLVDSRRSGSAVSVGGPGYRAPFFALLSEVSRRVKERTASAVAWTDAVAGQRIEDRHAVQTLDRSAATIHLGKLSRLQIDENSLVVIKRPRSLRATRASLVVLGGEVRGIVGPTAVGDKPLDLVTSSASGRIQAVGDEPAEFTVTVHEDESSTFSVYSGVAEVTAEGRTAVVHANESVTVAPSEPPGKLTKIPGLPRLLAPTDGFARTYGEITPRVLFRWTVADWAERYRLVIARDPGFDEIVYDDVVYGTEATHGNLSEGRYYWYVRGLSGRTKGRTTPPQRFEIVRDLEPPSFSVSLPEDPVNGERLVIRGTTEPGSRIHIGEDRVPVSDQGAFEYALTLRRGPNLVVVEAIDDAGNVAYHSQYVHARF